MITFNKLKQEDFYTSYIMTSHAATNGTMITDGLHLDSIELDELDTDPGNRTSLTVKNEVLIPFLPEEMEEVEPKLKEKIYKLESLKYQQDKKLIKVSEEVNTLK